MTVSLQDWLANAEHHYRRACDLFTLAKDEAAQGDPLLKFDPYLRMATWHTQTGGLAIGLARATSDHAAR